MKKLILFIIIIASFSIPNFAQYQICPDAIAFPVKTGCEIEALPEGPCVRMGSVVYSSTHQSLVTYNGTNWTLPNGSSMSAASNALTNVQNISLGTQAQDDAAYFGFSGAISEHYAVLSAPGIVSTNANYSGAIYIFKKNLYGIWTQVAVILNTPQTPYAYSDANSPVTFGRSIDISGNNIIVGSYYANTSITTGNNVNFFQIDPATNVVTHQGTFTNSLPNGNGDIGWGVKISGNYAIAPERPAYLYTCTTSPPLPATLNLRIYKKTGNLWTLNTILPIGKSINGANIDGDLISLTRTTSACAINLDVYKLNTNTNTWSSPPYITVPNIPFLASSGSMSRCGNIVKILFTKQAGNSGELLGNVYSLNTSTNSISSPVSMYHTVYTTNFPPFANGTSYIYNGNAFVGYEISGGNQGQNGYLNNGYQIPNHENRPRVIDADFGNLMYCSSGPYGYRVVIGKVF
jgi:hypothetical protein